MMNIIRRVIIVNIILLLFSCGGGEDSERDESESEQDEPEQDFDQSSYEINLQKWRDANIADYAFTYSRLCFCGPQEDIRVIVRSGSVQEAFYTPSGVYLDEHELEVERVLSIDGYFELIIETLERGADKVVVTYNELYGYPESIFIDNFEEGVDDEITYQITNFQ